MTDTPEIAAIRELFAARKEYADCPREGDAVDRAEARLDAAWGDLRALLAAHDARESAETVEVRIAVGVVPRGSYFAIGWSGADDDRMRTDAARNMHERHPVTRIITARVPLPQSQAIRGSVEHG